ncbi:hypothetical protein LINPERHAP2_LOCUS38420 [Linum perenne]
MKMKSPKNAQAQEQVHEGDVFRPENVEAWKKLWFHDFKHAFSTYFNYATREGFTIKIQYRSRSGGISDTSGRLIYITLSCRREGFKKGSKLKPKVQTGEAVMDLKPLMQQQRVHAEKRIGCLAKIRFHMNELAKNLSILHLQQNVLQARHFDIGEPVHLKTCLPLQLSPLLIGARVRINELAVRH